MAHHAWEIRGGDGPLVAAAIHDGDSVRANVRPYLALSDAARLTEQDPYTSSWTTIAPTRIVGNRSRFEFDLNRPRDKAVYLQPGDSWGLKVWNKELPNAIVDESLRLYDAFYEEVEELLEDLIDRHERLIIFDLHTYNHRRLGPYAECEDAERNPEVNVGTGTMDRRCWSKVVDRFVSDLRQHNFLGRTLDVRENVKFFGGNFPKWTHRRFPNSVCVLSIEFKKFFMDEWTGQVDMVQSEAIKTALAATVPGVLSELERL
jgi:N-formylglutamate amidohydrolase